MDRKRKKKHVKGQDEGEKPEKGAASALAFSVESRLRPDKAAQPLTQIALLRQQRAERKKERELKLKLEEEQRLAELAIAEAEAAAAAKARNEVELEEEEEEEEEEPEEEEVRPSVQSAQSEPRGVVASESETEVEEGEEGILKLLESEEGLKGFGWGEWRGEGEERRQEETEEEEKEEMEVEVKVEEEQEEEMEEPTEEAKPSESEFLSLMNRQVPEEDDLKLIFMERSSVEEEAEQTVADYPGVVGLDLSNDTLAFFELQNLSERDPPYAYISVKRIKLHIYTYREKSEFSAIQDLFKNYPDQTMLLGVDLAQATGHPYYFCTTIEARNLVINPPRKKRKIAIDAKQKEEEAWAKLASIVPRKWESLGSEVEVEDETVKDSRALLTVFAYRFREHFGRPVEFSNWKVEDNKNVYVEFPSKPQSEFPCIESLEVDVGVQVVQEKTTSSSQTGYSFKRNKIVQYDNQFMEPEQAQALLDLPADKIAKRTKALQRALIQNETLNAPPLAGNEKCPSSSEEHFKEFGAVEGTQVEDREELANLILTKPVQILHILAEAEVVEEKDVSLERPPQTDSEESLEEDEKKLRKPTEAASRKLLSELEEHALDAASKSRILQLLIDLYTGGYYDVKSLEKMRRLLRHQGKSTVPNDAHLDSAFVLSTIEKKFEEHVRELDGTPPAVIAKISKDLGKERSEAIKLANERELKNLDDKRLMRAAERTKGTEAEQPMAELKLEDHLGKEYTQFLEFEAELVARLKNTEPALEQNRERDIDEELEELVRAEEERYAAEYLGEYDDE